MVSVPAAVKKDRDSAFYGFTRSICPTCKKVIDAHVVLRGGQVFMEKKCSSHGKFEVLISSDAEYYIKSLTYTKPGTLPFEFVTRVEHGCPLDCGLCEDHLQHTCSPIFEINDKCDLTCPVCIVRNQQHYSISMEHFKEGVDKLIAKEGELPTLILSGGEPTLHPQFFELLAWLHAHPGIDYVLLNTNGVRLANDDAFARELGGVFRYGKLQLYLQFDGVQEAGQKFLRGADLRTTREHCLKRCQAVSYTHLTLPTIYSV